MKRFKLKQKLNNSRNITIVVVAFAVVGTLFLSLSHAANNGTLTLSPASSSVPLGSNFVVTIIENSSTNAVNAVQANLVYDQAKLEYVSTDISGGAFTTAGQNTGGSGTVNLALANVSAPVTGQQTVATVTFKAVALGSTNVSFAGSSALIESTNNTNVLASTTGATYTVVDSAAPSVPTGLTSTAQTATTVALSWTASTDNVGVTGYRIYRNGTQVGTSASTTYTDTGLTPLTAYTYKVAAYDAAGNVSAQTAGLGASTTADTAAPTVPTNLASGTQTLTTIALNWTASTDNVGVTGYRIYRNGTQIATSASTTYTNTGLTPGTSYSYTVAAYDAAGNVSAQTAAKSFSTLQDTAAPTVPTNLVSPSQTGTTVALSWTASTDNVGVTGYRIYRNGTQVGTSTSTSYTDTGLSPGVNYSYTVAAYDAGNNVSAQSTARSVTTVVKAGDANGDGLINIYDLSILASNFGGSGKTRDQGDFNSDGVVNIYDLSILASNWGK